MPRRSTEAILLSAGIILALANTPVSAADYYWACGSGNWNSTCWSNTLGGAPTFGPPPPGNNGFLYNSGAANINVTVSSYAEAHNVTINATGTGAMTVSLLGDTFAPLSGIHVGNSGTGTFNQLSGHLESYGNIFVGPQGTYNLYGGNTILNGIDVAGTFNQSGGRTGGGLDVKGTGTYNQSGGVLQTGEGNFVRGIFNQTGGERSGGGVMSLSGIYNLSNGSASDQFMAVDGRFNQTGGDYSVQFLSIDSTGIYNFAGGKLTVANISGPGAFNFTGGTLSVNQFNGDLINAGGTLAPGTPIPIGHDIPPLATNISGNYTQSRSGTYAVDIGGLLKGTEYDVLSVGGTAYLDGLLKVSFLDLGSGLFSPHLGDSFDVLSAEQVVGSFRYLWLPNLGDNLSWNINYLADAMGTTDIVRLSVAPIPEPEIYAMMIAGLGVLGFVARRKILRAAAV